MKATLSLSLSLSLSNSPLKSNKRYFQLALIFFFAGFLFLGGVGKASAATYYVDSSIADTYVGNATPDFTTYDSVALTTTGGVDLVFKTIADVNSKGGSSGFSPGDQILLRKGQSWNETLQIADSGTSGSPITFGSFGAGGNPAIKNVLGRAYLGGGDWVIIQDLDISNPAGHGIEYRGYSNVIFRRLSVHNSSSSGMSIVNESSDYPSDITIDSCNIHNNAGYGIWAYLDGTSFINNVVAYSNGSNASENNISASSYSAGSVLTFQDTTSYLAGGNGFGSAAADATGITIFRRCKAYSNDEAGFIIHGTVASTYKMYNCLSYNNGTSGTTGIGINVGTLSTNPINTEIYNCTIYGNKFIGVFNQAIGTHLFKNNIIYSNGEEAPASGMQISWLQSGATLTTDYNLISEHSLGHTIYVRTAPTSYKTLTQWQSYSGNIYDQQTLNSNPLFTDQASNDFTLQSISPAINAGTPVGLTTDYAGNPVPSGALPDIGAYEFQDSTAPTTSNNITAGTYASVQSIALTCDDGAGVGCDKTYYTLDGTDPTTSSTQYSTQISTPDNATTVFKYFSRDRNENSESIRSRTYTIDTIAPNTTITSNPDTLINTNSATFSFSASETSTFQCKIDEEAYATCTSPKNYTSLTEGEHTFSVKATDTATNIDATPASYTFTVDTQVPTISDLSPNNTTLLVTTTSTNFTLTTSETATCKYSTVQNTSYAEMTTFDTTDSTTHSTLISNLNAGTTYNYYLKCQDSINNESDEEHLTFSIAPEEQKISLNSIKIKIDRETNKFKDKIYAKEKKLKLQGQDFNLANGQIKIYKNNKLWKTIQVDAQGAWSKLLKFKDNFLGSLKIRQYDQYGTQLASQKEKIKIDAEKPKIFTASPLYIKHHGSILAWTANDNDQIDYYKVSIAGRIIKTKQPKFIIPVYAPKGSQMITISAYDRAGNKTSVQARLVVSW